MGTLIMLRRGRFQKALLLFCLFVLGLSLLGNPAHAAVQSPAPAQPPSPTQAPAPRYSQAQPVSLSGGNLAHSDKPGQAGIRPGEDPRPHRVAGPEEEVRLIVELRGQPVAPYLSRNAASAPLRVAADADLRSHVSALAAQHREVKQTLSRRGIGGTLIAEYSYLLNGFALSTKMKNKQLLEQLPQVAAVYPDYESKVALNQSVPLIGAPTVWAMNDATSQSVTGRGIRVAIIDTGVDYTHPDLGGCFGSGCRVVAGYDFANGDSDPMDDNGHGTHVAGIVAARGTLKGVAPDATLLAYKACNQSGSCFDSWVLAALEQAANPDKNPATNDGAQVINLSLSRSNSTPDDTLSLAVDNAVLNGIVVVVAAGNDGPGHQTLGTPGTARQAITVAAANKADQLASFSSRGPIYDYFEVLKPDITAPGVGILSTVPAAGQLGNPKRYSTLSGTSMASPHVAGAAALLRQLHPGWTPEMIKANLMNTAKDIQASPYEQGAGRVQADQAAATTLLALPGSIGFGLPLMGGRTSAEVTLHNTGAAPVNVSASIATVRWADGGLNPLTPPAPVSYASISSTSLNLAAGGSQTISVDLSLPSTAADGYYKGKITFQGGGQSVSVPFVFAIVSRLEVRLLDQNGNELGEGDGNSIYLFGVPDADVAARSYKYPGTFYIPSGTYNVHTFSRIATYYDDYFDHGGPPRTPLILSKTITVPPNSRSEVFVSAQTARRYTVKTTTFAGDDMLLREWRAAFRYQNAGKQYILPFNTYDVIYEKKDRDLPGPPPAGVDFLISDTPANTSFTFVGMGFGYSPQLRRFRDLNSQRWYDDETNRAGMLYEQWSDEVYYLSWTYPKLDASTPKIFSYAPGEVRKYTFRQDIPGTLDAFSCCGWPATIGGHAAIYLPTDTGAVVSPIPLGFERTLYVKGAFSIRSVHEPNTMSQHEFFTQDWTKATPMPSFPHLRQVNAWDLQPLPPGSETDRVGAGPLYPALTFLNSASTIGLISPILGNGRGNGFTGGSPPSMTVYKDGSSIASAPLTEEWWTPTPMRPIAAQGSGSYRVHVEDFDTRPVSPHTIVDAGFTLPASDMNPPQITALEMPQRFAPNTPFTVDLTASDPGGAVSSVTMRYSLTRGAIWINAPVTLVGGRYRATINPGAAGEVSLSSRVTDQAGNYLEFITHKAAILETPATLTITPSRTSVPLTSSPVSIHLSGSLRDGGGQPLASGGVPIAIYVNDKLAGYVRDKAALPSGGFQYGTIDFDWSFVPTDFVSAAGQSQLKFVFDLGTYRRQEQIVNLAIGSDSSAYPNGTPWVVPGTIQAENFDTGGQGLAYNDTDATNNGGQYRPSEAVDIQSTTDTGSGFNVGWTRAGEWLKYTINVASTGSYIFNARVASAAAGAKFHVEIDGANVTGPLSVPNTGGNQAWTTLSKPGINLTAGQHVMRVVFDTAVSGGASVGNYNFFTFSRTPKSYEAEAGILKGAAKIMSCAACSGGKKVGFIGSGAANFVTIDNVSAGSSGTHTLKIYYLVDGTRSFSVSVNGGPAVTVTVSGTSFSTVASTTINVPLNAGNNTIKFFNNGAYAPDLDRIVIQ